MQGKRAHIGLRGPDGRGRDRYPAAHFPVTPFPCGEEMPGQMEGTGEAAPFFLFCTDLFLKHESRNITDISFFMMVFVLYDALPFIFSSCFSVLNVFIQVHAVLFRCKNILNRFMIRVTLNEAYKILY